MSLEDRKIQVEIIIAIVLVGGVMAWILIPVSFQADTIILVNESGGTPESCIPSGGLVLAQNLTDLCDVVIITPINNQILAYNGSFWVNANITAIDDTICANVGSGAEVYKDGECNFRTIVGSPDISVIQNLNEIVIDFNGTAGGDTTACINVGTGTGYSCIEGTNVNLRSLLAGSGISITNNTNTITITNTAPDNTACFNVGSGFGVYSGGECQFDSLIAGDGITITDTTDDLTFTSTCENTGTGEPICESDNNINSLIAGNNTSIIDTTGDLTIHSLITGNLAGEVGLTSTSITKTNIGTSYVDLYPCATISQNMNCFTTIDCSRALQLFIRFSWDHVGTGNQQFRIVDFNSDANVLWESPSFTTDQSTGSTVTYIDKPSWCTSSIQSIQAQGKSDVGTDDPIFYMYRVYMR